MAINKDFIIPDAGLQVNGAAVISSSLGVNGAVTIANTLTVNGALTVANTIAVGNTTVTGNVNVSVAANVGGAVRAGGLITGAAGADITGTANASVAINVGANVNLSVTAVNVGNSTSNTVVTQTLVNTGNSTLFTTIGQATGLFGNSTVNTFITNSSIRTGNSSVYTNVTATALTTNGTLSVTGAATFSNSVAVTGAATFSNNVTVSGDFTVSGTTTFVNTATLNVSDNIIALNTDVTLAPSENAGVEVNRGTSSNVSLIWNETTDRWQISSNTTTFGNIHSTLADVALGTDTSGAYVATITGGNGLTGSGTGEGSTPTLVVVAGTELTSNSTGVHHNDITRTNTTTGSTAPNYAGTFTAVDSVTTNARGHVTGVNTKTVTMPSSNNTTYDMVAVANTTASNAILRLADSSNANDNVFFVGTDEVVTSSNATHIVIDHADVARADATSAASPASGGTFTAIDTVTTNARGHVTAVNLKTVTLPIDPDTNTTYDLLAVANTSASNAMLRLQNSSNANDTIFFVGTDEVVTSSNATHVVIDHADVTRSDASSSASPASGGTFTAVDSVTTNARGHLTAINLKTVTLPVDPNTTYDLASVANTVANEGLVNLTGSNLTTDTAKIIGLDEIAISSNATAVYVDHIDVARTNNTSAASPASGGTFTAVDSITTNARGHVTAINTKTVTLPIDPDTNTTYDLATVANTVANEGLVNLVGSNSITDTGKIIGLDEITISSNTTAIYVDHNDVARTNNTSAASPASGGTFTAVDSITTNARGHITAINTKTVTLPIDPDTNTTYDLVSVANTVANEGRVRLTASTLANDDVLFVGGGTTVISSNASQVLVSTADQYTGTVTQVSSGNGLTGGPITATGTLSVVAGASLVSNATGVHMPDTGTAGARTGGISAITTDAQGRVTVVTGSAGYVTTSGVTQVSSGNGLTGGPITATGTLSVSAGDGLVSNATGVHMASVGTAGARTGGISAITTDAQGRVTAVTGSAGYVTTSGVTQVSTGNGLTGGPITATGSVSVLANNGIVANATGVFVTAGNGLVANSTGVHMATVATAGASSGGISAITIDDQGRVTSVTGSAGYVTSSGVTSVSGTTGRITSSGGATPAIDLATAGAGASSYASGISAITVDAYGRVISVTGSAGYVTSSGVTSVGGTGSINGLTLSGTVTSTGNLTLGGSVTSVSTSGNFQMNSLGVGIAGSGTAGTIRATGDITAFATSDRTFKTNITPIENALGKIRSLSGVMFDWTDAYIEAQGGEDGYFVRKHDTGIIAQDVQAVLPEVVATREDGTLAVKYEKMMGLVIQSINELADLVDEMKKGN